MPPRSALHCLCQLYQCWNTELHFAIAEVHCQRLFSDCRNEWARCAAGCKVVRMCRREVVNVLACMAMHLSISFRSFSCTLEFRASRYDVKAIVVDVVSWPARKKSTHCAMASISLRPLEKETWCDKHFAPYNSLLSSNYTELITARVALPEDLLTWTYDAYSDKTVSCVVNETIKRKFTVDQLTGAVILGYARQDYLKPCRTLPDNDVTL